MKTTIFKVAFVVLLSFALVQSSEAGGRYGYRYCGRGYYAPRAYYGAHYYAPRYYGAGYYAPWYYGYAPRYYAPVAYAPVFVPGHWFVNRYGVRAWVRPHYR